MEAAAEARSVERFGGDEAEDQRGDVEAVQDLRSEIDAPDPHPDLGHGVFNQALHPPPNYPETCPKLPPHLPPRFAGRDSERTISFPGNFFSWRCDGSASV